MRQPIFFCLYKLVDLKGRRYNSLLESGTAGDFTCWGVVRRGISLAGEWYGEEFHLFVWYGEEFHLFVWYGEGAVPPMIGM